MHRTLAIIEREMRRFSKSPMLIVMSMVFPLLQLIVLGYAWLQAFRPAYLRIMNGLSAAAGACSASRKSRPA